MRAGAFDGYIFVVDTDRYAGNFEREMTAYVTGVIGDCGTGKDCAKMFSKEVGLEQQAISEKIDQVPDEHGCYRPADIYPTPGFFNDGLGNAWPIEKKGSKEVIEKYKKSLQEHELDNNEPGCYPSYQSVAMFFYKKPTEQDICFLKERSKKFCEVLPMKYGPKQINILGFRLVREKIVLEEETV